MTNTGMLELCYLYYDEKTMEHAKRVANEAKSLCNLFKLPYANLYYDEKTMEHAKRVANEAKSLCNLFKFPYAKDNFVYQLGLAHDLYEDTTIKQGAWFDNDFEENLQLLTKEKDVDYNDYIAKIRRMAASNSKYMPAYIVKLADMHDHFAQVDTLTDKLKNKYMAAMPYLI